MKLYRLLILIFSFILVIAVVLSIKFAFVSADAPYYLSIARDISNGLIPYKDINSGYTPLMMYINSVLYIVFDRPSYTLFLSLQYIIILFSGILLYVLVTKELKLNRGRAILLSLFFCTAILSSDGTEIILEVYSILFVLLAFITFFKKKYLLAGVLLAVTFFFKQYGILNFIPFYLLILLAEDNKIGKIVRLSIGGLIPLVLFLMYFTLLHSVGVNDLFYQLSGQGYGEHSLESGKSVATILIGGKVFILLVFSLLISWHNLYNSKLAIVLVVGIAVSLIPVIVQSFQHYWLNSFPYLFLLLAIAWNKESRSITPSLTIATIIISVLLFTRIYRYKDKMQEQLQIAKKTEEFYPKGSNVFLLGDIRNLYILNDYRNPALKEVGYNYLFRPSLDFMKSNEVITKSDIIDIEPKQIMNINSEKVFIY